MTSLLSNLTAFQRRALATARKTDADARWQLRPDGLLEIEYTPAEERRRKKPGRDEYVEGRHRRHTIRVHASAKGHPPSGRCGYQWQYCDNCRPDLQQINAAEMQTTAVRSSKVAKGIRDENQPSIAASARAETDIDRGMVEGYEHWVETRRAIARSRERGLVEEFCRFLEKQRRELKAFEIQTADDVIFCDVYDASRHILFEAKADALERAQIRMAIGQLLDYSISGFSDDERRTLKLAVLLPHRPKSSIERLLDVLTIGLVWRDESGGFKERYPQ